MDELRMYTLCEAQVVIPPPIEKEELIALLEMVELNNTVMPL